MLGNAQAEPYYGMDKDRKDVSVKSIKCNNINVNVNGLELNLTSVPFLSNLLASEANADEGERGANSYGSGSGSYDDKKSDSDNFRFVCINNNNNTVVAVNEPPSEEPTTGTLNVIKQVSCTDQRPPNSISVQQAVTPCQLFEELITENSFIIRVEGNNPIPSQFPGSPEGTEVTLGPGNYRVIEERIPIPTELLQQFPNIITFIPTQTFSGDCTGQVLSATGAIEAGESQTCNIENNFLIELAPLTEP